MIYLKKQRSKSEYESEVTVYECEACIGCPYKEKCTKAKGNKHLRVSKSFLRKREEAYQNIQSKKGIKYRMNRSIQVEGAFGVLKNDYGECINTRKAVCLLKYVKNQEKVDRE